MVQSFVVDFVERVVSVPTGAHLACYQAEQWNRGYTRFATKEKKKSVRCAKSAHHKHQVKKPQQNGKTNSSALQEVGTSCNHFDISRLFGRINSSSNQHLPALHHPASRQLQCGGSTVNTLSPILAQNIKKHT